MRCDYCFFVYTEGEVCPVCNFKNGSPADEPFYLYPGTVIGKRYVIGKTLGAGGFGIVYKAWDNLQDKAVAIKEFYPSGLVTRTPGKGRIKLVAKNREHEFHAGRKRFAAEYLGTMGISQAFPENQTLIHDVSALSENGTSYLVMEYVDGINLTEFIEKNGPMRCEEALVLTRNILEAVGNMHSLKIIHRDISPDNIIITPLGSVKLIDLGAGKFGKDDKTVEAERIMKPGFSPPEQYEPKERSGVFTDIYSVGASLYFMLTGLTPVESTNRKDKDLLAAPSSLVDSIPEYVSEAILKAMAVDLRLRFKDANSFVKALSGEKKVVRPEKDLLRRKVRRLTTVAATFVVFIIVGSFTYINAMNRIPRLNDASIELWFVETGNYVQREQAYAEIIAYFNFIFPNVEIELVGIPYENFYESVRNAIARGLPVLFESHTLKNADVADTLDLTSVANNVLGITQFLDRYLVVFPNRTQIPIGFSVSAIYLNTTMSNFGGSTAATLAELGTTIAVQEGAEEDFRSIFPGASFAPGYNFFQDDAGALFASTANLVEIRRLFPGRYRLIGVNAPQVPASFGGFFSVVDSTTNEIAAKLRLIEFMLEERAQDVLHIRNQSGLIPLNTKAFEIFRDEYGGFRYFFDNIERFYLR